MPMTEASSFIHILGSYGSLILQSPFSLTYISTVPFLGIKDREIDFKSYTNPVLLQVIF